MSAHEAKLDADLHGHGDTHGHGSRRSYLTGFALSALLTAVPFWLVMTGAIASAQVAAAIIIGLAIVQILVHTFFFLHINTRAEGGWTLMALVFALVMITIVISGSVWIMYHLNSNMMPMTPASMPTAP
jgi:cytochrome o ubiquinol oxidase operon protein cyoD